MNINLIDINPENPYSDLIQPDDETLISDAQELDNVEPLDQEPLSTQETININYRLQQLNNNLKVDIVLPDGTVLEGKDPEIPKKQSPRLHPAPNYQPTEIINTPNITPNYSQTLRPFLVQKRILGLKHRDVSTKYYIAIIDGKDEYPAIIQPAIPQVDQSKSHAEIAVKSLNIETRFGKPVLAEVRKKYTKEELSEYYAEKQRQRELLFNEDPEIEITSDNEEYITPDVITKLKVAKNIKEVTRAIPIGLRSQPQELRKYKESTIEKNIIKPDLTSKKIEINLPEYRAITLENNLIPEIGESEDEFKFRVYWTQLAKAIADNLSDGNLISLGKMKRQKLIYGVNFNSQMEELINTVDSVYVLNPFTL